MSGTTSKPRSFRVGRELRLAPPLDSPLFMFECAQAAGGVALSDFRTGL